MALSVGQELQQGKYKIESELGRGRFGITYLARDREGNGHVIKTLNDQTLNNPDDFERWQQNFVKEAWKLKECDHPHIVKAEDIFKEAGLWCIVMEYVEGINLEKRSQARLSETDALKYIHQIGEALIAVHSRNLIHRDVQPENIMVRTNGDAILIDFGLSRTFDHPLTVTRLEETTGGFTAPELYSRNKKVGAFTDIYSLSATLYVLLTGKRPATPEERIVNHIPLKPPKDINQKINESCDRAILKGLELNPKERPQTVREWLDLLPELKKSTQRVKSPTNWGKIGAIAGVIGVVIAAIALIPAWWPIVEKFLQPPPEETQ